MNRKQYQHVTPPQNQNQHFQNNHSHHESEPLHETALDLYRKMGEEEFNRNCVAPEKLVNRSEEDQEEIKEKEEEPQEELSSKVQLSGAGSDDDEEDEIHGKAFGIYGKMSVSSPDDESEIEADRTAEQVMTSRAEVSKSDSEGEEEIKPKEKYERMDTKTLYGKILKGELKFGTKSKLHYKPVFEGHRVYFIPLSEEAKAKEQAELKEMKRQSSSAIPANISAKINSKRGNGSSLSAETRTFMEPRLGADFSGVKIHNDSDSHAISKSLNAKAFAVGSDVFFAQGQYNPHSYEGKKLMAHELAHTIQTGSVQRKIHKKSNEQPVHKKEENSPGLLSTMSIKGLHAILKNIPDKTFAPFTVAGIIFKYGATGFLERLLKAGGAKINTAVSNALRAFTSPAYLKGYLSGTWYGFKDIGFLGTIDLFKMIIKFPGMLFNLGKKVFKFFGDGGLSKAALAVGSKMLGLGKWLTLNGNSVIKKLLSGGALNSAGGFLNKLVSSAKGKVREAGNKFASVLLKFFLQPIGKIGSELGHIMGSVVGTVLFEVVFALVTWVWERQFLLLRAL